MRQEDHGFVASLGYMVRFQLGAGDRWEERKTGRSKGTKKWKKREKEREKT